MPHGVDGWRSNPFPAIALSPAVARGRAVDDAEPSDVMGLSEKRVISTTEMGETVTEEDESTPSQPGTASLRLRKFLRRRTRSLLGEEQDAFFKMERLDEGSGSAEEERAGGRSLEEVSICTTCLKEEGLT